MSSIFAETQPQEILKHQLNDSKSKFHYSFAKQERFQSPKQSCQRSFYDPVDVAGKRSTNFGLGVKSDFTKTTYSNYAPESNYNIDSTFETQKKKEKGKSFGASRDLTKSQGYIPQQRIGNPGPDRYSLKSLAKSIKYSMRPKTVRQQNPSFLGGTQSFAENPGPGAYAPEASINETGKYNNAKYKGSGSKTFNPTTSQRFSVDKFKTSIMPGPGSHKYTYEVPKNSGKGTFGGAVRTTFIDLAAATSTPGVGQYRKPSDFGHYSSTRVLKEKKKNRSHSQSQLQSMQHHSFSYQQQ